MAHNKVNALRLPAAILGLSDLRQVIRELSMLDSLMVQNNVHYPGSAAKASSAGYLLQSMAKYNDLDLAVDCTRAELKNFFNSIESNAVTIHIGLAQEVASNSELETIINWLRSELHPLTLLHVGLQPEIIGGCTIRTVNHYYDFSLKRHFDEARSILLSKMKAL